jgi:hypothetical protein
MRKLLTLTFALLLILAGPIKGTWAAAAFNPVQDQDAPNRRVMTVPGARRRRVLGDRPRHRGIRGSFKEAGKSAGGGGKRLGQNMADGRPVRGGKEFGKGMGGFGKHVGMGTGKIGKRVGHATKRALTP